MIEPRSTTIKIPDHVVQAGLRRLRVAEWMAGDTRSRCTIDDLRAEGFVVIPASLADEMARRLEELGGADTNESVA